jgi:hypothetical protein
MDQKTILTGDPVLPILHTGLINITAHKMRVLNYEIKFSLKCQTK